MKATKRRTASKVYRRPAKRKPAKPTAAIVVQAPSPKPWELSTEEATILKNAICPGATDKEFQFCLEVSRRYRIDPFTGGVHFVPRWNSQAMDSEGKRGATVLVPVVGIDGLLRIAARDHADFGSYSEVEYGPMVDVQWTDKQGKRQTFKAPEWARVEALRKGAAFPTVAKVWWEEIYPNVDNSPMVRRMPRLMLGKCAKANATRTSYPATGGLLIPEETHTREFQDITPGGRVFAPVQSGGSVAAAQAVGQRIIEEKKQQIAARTSSPRGNMGAEVRSGNGGWEHGTRPSDTPPASAPTSTSASPAAPVAAATRKEARAVDMPTKLPESLKTPVGAIEQPKRASDSVGSQPQTPGNGPQTPPAKTEAAFDAKAAAAVKGKTVKIYPLSIGGIAAWAFQPEPIEPLAYLLDHGLKDIAVFASGAKRWYIVDDQAVLAAVKKVAAEFGITIEAVTGPGPMAPPAAQVPPSGVKAAPEPPSTAGTATIQSAEEVPTASNKIYLKVLFGGQSHSCWDKKGWEAIKASKGQSAEFDIEVKGQYRNIVGIKRIGKREYEGWEPVRTLDDMGQISFF